MEGVGWSTSFLNTRIFSSHFPSIVNQAPVTFNHWKNTSHVSVKRRGRLLALRQIESEIREASALGMRFSEEKTGLESPPVEVKQVGRDSLFEHSQN